jgi:hypothetical protein
LTLSLDGAACGTGGSAASFCGDSVGFAVSGAASACAFATPFRNTSSTIWSK